MLARFLGSLPRRIWRELRARGAAKCMANGARLQQSGDYAGACREYERVLESDPDNVDAHYLLGVNHARCKRHETALEHLLKAGSLKPDFVDVHIDLGNVHWLLRDSPAAEASYRKALSLAPNAALAHFNLAGLLRELGRRDQGLEHLRQAHLFAPDRVDVLWNLVSSLVEREHYTEAVEVAEAAARRIPGSYEIQRSLGFAYLKAYALTEAVACYDKALCMRADDAELHTRRAIALQDLGRLAEAFASYDRALEICPGFPLAKFHRAVAYLLAGDYARGWIDYETRLISEDRPRRRISYPRWDGAPLADRAILVHGEGGLGDEIMFASCLPEVIAAAKRCVIECAPKLEGIFRRSFPGATVYAASPDRSVPALVAAGGFDVEVAIGSLPLFLRRSRAEFSRHSGYLKADPERIEFWRNRLEKLGPGLKVGISWRGGTHITRKPLRSIELVHWMPILCSAGTRFISLQYPDAGSTLRELKLHHGVEVMHWQEAIDDYDETAALVCALDLVISVCTSVIHRGGALGRPVWVMAPYSPEWRYGIDGESMPWYPSVRVFRQPAYGQWNPMIITVADDLRRRIADLHGQPGAWRA